MKIAIVTPEVGTGGWSRYVRNLSEALRGRGIICEVVAVRGRSLSSMYALWRGIRNADIVHAIDPMPIGFFAYIAALARRIPFVLTAQGTYAVAPLYNRKTALLSRMAYRGAAAVIAISRFTRGEILNKVPGIAVDVINHGVWLKLFESTTRKPPEHMVLLSVGGLKRRKGYHVALEAVALLRKKYPDLRYIIVGPADSPGYARALEERASQEDLRGAVEFGRDISDQELRRLYDSAGIFLLPAINEGHHFEGFGLVFLEAAAAGLPSVGTRGNGIEDAILDGETGVLVPQNDPGAAAAAVERVWGDVERMSERASAFAKERDWSIVAGEYEALYTRVLAR